MSGKCLANNSGCGIVIGWCFLMVVLILLVFLFSNCTPTPEHLNDLDIANQRIEKLDSLLTLSERIVDLRDTEILELKAIIDQPQEPESFSIIWNEPTFWGSLKGYPLAKGYYDFRLCSQSDTIYFSLSIEEIEVINQRRDYKPEVRSNNRYMESEWVPADLPFYVMGYYLYRHEVKRMKPLSKRTNKVYIDTSGNLNIKTEVLRRKNIRVE